MNIMGLSQEDWLMIHAVIFIVTAFVIWRQLKTVSRASSIESFNRINDDLRNANIRRLRKKLYRKGAKLNISGIQRKYDDLRKVQKQSSKYQEEPNRIKKSIDSTVDEMMLFFKNEKLEEQIQDLIVILDAMGVIVNKGGVAEEIMIDMHWDVIIKSWDCLFPVVYRERARKSEYLREGTTKKRLHCFFRYFSRYIEFLWIKKIRRKGDPASKGFGFTLLDFCPATSYSESHYENFEILTRNAEWYAWKRGISRPELYEKKS